jgi:hypothetical protein
LNVELDVANWTNRPVGATQVPLDGLIADELAKACVVAKEFSSGSTNPPSVSDNLTNNELMNVLGIQLNSENGIEIDPTNNQSGRDIPYSTEDFWTVRIVTIPRYSTIGGAFHQISNSIFFCYDRISEMVTSWNSNCDPDVTLQDFIRLIVLHEICHALIDAIENVVTFDSNGIPHDSLGQEISNISNSIGVRNTILRSVNNITITDFAKALEFSHLLRTDIKDIQFYSRVRS